MKDGCSFIWLFWPAVANGHRPLPAAGTLALFVRQNSAVKSLTLFSMSTKVVIRFEYQPPFISVPTILISVNEVSILRAAHILAPAQNMQSGGHRSQSLESRRHKTAVCIRTNRRFSTVLLIVDIFSTTNCTDIVHVEPGMAYCEEAKALSPIG
jgi:hypothetical protein